MATASIGSALSAGKAASRLRQSTLRVGNIAKICSGHCRGLMHWQSAGRRPRRARSHQLRPRPRPCRVTAGYGRSSRQPRRPRQPRGSHRHGHRQPRGSHGHTQPRGSHSGHRQPRGARGNSYSHGQTQRGHGSRHTQARGGPLPPGTLVATAQTPAAAEAGAATATACAAADVQQHGVDAAAPGTSTSNTGGEAPVTQRQLQSLEDRMDALGQAVEGLTNLLAQLQIRFGLDQ